MFNDLVTRHKDAVWAVQRKFNLSDYAHNNGLQN